MNNKDIPTRCPECKLMPEVIERLEEDLVDIVTDKQYIGLSAQEARELRIKLLNQLRELFQELVK